MAPTPFFLLGAASEDTSAHAVAPDHSDAVARAASGPGRQQAASGGGGTPLSKTPKRGPGVAELERLRCGCGGAPPRKTPNPQRGLSVAELERLCSGGVDPQHDLNSVVLQQHHDYLPAFDAATGSCYYSPLLGDRETRPPAAATNNAPYYSIHDLAATLPAARKETAGEGFAAAEGRKEVREIEFFPTRVTSHSGPDESELRTTPPSSSLPPGGVGGSLDLSLRL
ncbi:uncharacterized protein LOC125536872 [Triticum urartu]|uniref:uncharacterized protein LOC125536872 n=1 Tax=Triticum urartu TaxID=4572 RepID=UPI00204320BE|nr:uncharacterized protein LOC125536872 [Triticum urartu]